MFLNKNKNSKIIDAKLDEIEARIKLLKNVKVKGGSIKKSKQGMSIEPYRRFATDYPRQITIVKHLEDNLYEGSIYNFTKNGDNYYHNCKDLIPNCLVCSLSGVPLQPGFMYNSDYQLDGIHYVSARNNYSLSTLVYNLDDDDVDNSELKFITNRYNASAATHFHNDYFYNVVRNKVIKYDTLKNYNLLYSIDSETDFYYLQYSKIIEIDAIPYIYIIYYVRDNDNGYRLDLRCTIYEDTGSRLKELKTETIVDINIDRLSADYFSCVITSSNKINFCYLGYYPSPPVIYYKKIDAITFEVLLEEQIDYTELLPDVKDEGGLRRIIALNNDKYFLSYDTNESGTKNIVMSKGYTNVRELTNNDSTIDVDMRRDRFRPDTQRNYLTYYYTAEDIRYDYPYILVYAFIVFDNNGRNVKQLKLETTLKGWSNSVVFNNVIPYPYFYANIAYDNANERIYYLTNNIQYPLMIIDDEGVKTIPILDEEDEEFNAHYFYDSWFYFSKIHFEDGKLCLY